MYELLSPKVDFIFKKIFGNEKNPDILISFLTGVLNPEYPITHIQIKNTDLDKDFLKDKFSRLDVKATTSNNEAINIEIQRVDKKNMCERTLYYWSKMYTENIVEGEDYHVLPKTICVNILDYNIKEISSDYYHNIFRLTNTNIKEVLTDKIEIHFIELKKFKDCDINNLLDLWIEFIKNPASSIIQTVEENNKEIKKAKTELKVISADDDERQKYQIREDTIREELNALNGAKSEGIEQGRIEGRLEGRLYEKLDIAKNMIIAEIDDLKISKFTGLSIEDILKLKNK